MAQHRRGRGTGRAGHRTGPAADAALPAAAVRNPADGPAGVGLRADDRHSGHAHLPHRHPVSRTFHRVVVRCAHGTGARFRSQPGPGHTRFDAARRGVQGPPGRLRSQWSDGAQTGRKPRLGARTLWHQRGRHSRGQWPHHPEQRGALCHPHSRHALAHRAAAGATGPPLRRHRGQRPA